MDEVIRVLEDFLKIYIDKFYNELGIEKVYLDCDIDNPGSYKTMEALGGVREKIYTHPNHEGEIYRYSPYALLINEGNYYMIASDIRGKKLYHFRVDRMKGVKLVCEERTGKDGVPEADKG